MGFPSVPAITRPRFVKLAGLAFALVFLGFMVRGTTRLFLSDEIATVISAPFMLIAFAIVSVLFVRGFLDITGIRPIE